MTPPDIANQYIDEEVRENLKDLGARIKEKRGRVHPGLTRSEFAETFAKVTPEEAKAIEYGNAHVPSHILMSYLKALDVQVAV